MKSATIKRLAAAGLIYLLLSLLYFGAILVGPGTPAAISALHWQETNAHGVRVPDPCSLHFHHVWGDLAPRHLDWGARSTS